MYHASEYNGGLAKMPESDSHALLPLGNRPFPVCFSPLVCTIMLLVPLVAESNYSGMPSLCLRQMT